MSQKSNPILSYLQKHEVHGPRAKYSNTSIDLKKKYYISPEKYPAFLKLYAENINGTNLCITEKCNNISHVKYDLDLSYKISEGVEVKRYIQMNEDIRDFIDAVQNVCIRTFMINKDDKDTLRAYVMARPEPRQLPDGIVRDGFHIHFPNLFLSHKKALFLYNRVIHTLKINEFLSNYKTEPFNLQGTLNTIIDKGASLNNPWTMYGSTKFCNKTNKWLKPYELQQIFTHTATSIKPKILKTVRSNTAGLTNQLSVKYGKDNMKFADMNTRIAFETAQMKEHTSKKVVKLNKKQTKELYEELKFLLSILSEFRAKNYNDWRDVGASIHSALPTPDGLNLFIEFSKSGAKSFKGTEDVKNTWEGFKCDGNTGMITVGSLKYWAKKDNYSAYVKYYMSKYKPKSSSSFKKKLKAMEIARITMHIFGQNHCYITPKKSRNTYWIYFHNHRWHDDGDAMHLREVIDIKMPEIFLAQRREYLRLQSEAVDEEEEERMEKLAERCKSISEMLQERHNIEKVIYFCRQFHTKHEDELEDLMDEDRTKIGFNDGVVDVSSGKPVFRDGRPDDWIRKTVGYNYPGPYDPSSDKAVEFAKFRESIHPGIHRPVGEYLWAMFALCINGYTKQQFIEVSGEGANGKSITTGIIRKVFGEYYCSLPPTLVTQKRGKSSDATPDLYKAKGARIVMLQEPERDDRLNVGLMKEFTGGDEIYARNLFSTPITYKPQFLAFMCCNVLLPYDDPTNGTKRRIRNVCYKVKFCENPDEHQSTEEEPVRKMDGGLSLKTEGWTQTVMAYLLYIYPQIIQSKYYQEFGEAEVPIATREATDDYNNKCNQVKCWISEELEFLDDAMKATDTTSVDEDSFVIHQRDLMEAYKEWCKMYSHPMKGSDFKEEISRVFKRRNVQYNPKKKIWMGVRIMGDEEGNESY